MNKLYVGNLDYGVTGDQLSELFSQAGKVVNAMIITDRYSGRSKGFGFVEMSNEEEAKKAIEMWLGIIFFIVKNSVEFDIRRGINFTSNDIPSSFKGKKSEKFYSGITI